MNESDWAVRPRRPQLTFDAFCTQHEPAWRAVASVHLPDQEAVEAAMERTKNILWQDWARMLRMPIPASHAWNVAKEQIGEALVVLHLLGLLNAPSDNAPSDKAPEWDREVRNALTETGHELDDESGWRELRHAVKGLSERRRDVVLLKFWLDLPDSTIAQYLDTTEANVRSTASQALDRIATALGRPRKKPHHHDQAPEEDR